MPQEFTTLRSIFYSTINTNMSAERNCKKGQQQGHSLG